MHKRNGKKRKPRQRGNRKNRRPKLSRRQATLPMPEGADVSQPGTSVLFINLIIK
jgi:hypothetical protein